MKSLAWWTVVVLLAVLCWPPQWYPPALRLQLNSWFGAASFRSLPTSREPQTLQPESRCPQGEQDWGDKQIIDSVLLRAAPTCSADNPYLVAAVVRGTNNIDARTLARSGLTA